VTTGCSIFAARDKRRRLRTMLAREIEALAGAAQRFLDLKR